MCTVATVTVQLPLAAKLTVRPEDEVALTLKSASPQVALASAPKVIVWLIFDTVRSALPLLLIKELSPAKAAATAAGDVPAGVAATGGGSLPAVMPVRLTPVTVATPETSVVPLPTLFPLSVKLIDFPLTPVALDVRVAERSAVPLYGPEAGFTARDVTAATTSLKQMVTLLSVGVTVLSVVVSFA